MKKSGQRTTRRSVMLTVLLLSTVASAKPGVEPRLVQHFMARTGFIAAPDEITTASNAIGYEELVHETIQKAKAKSERDEAREPIAFTSSRTKKVGKLSRKEKRAHRKDVREDIAKLSLRWMNDMLTTKTPLFEKMVLFWHNHFVTSSKKVKNAHLLAEQHQLFRTHALGSFATLLKEMVRNPALLLYLDNQKNHQSAPNENFARELLELFTLGEGNYAEDDIKEVARAFTGYSIDKQKKFKKKKKQHDEKQKTIFGQTGNFDGDAVVDLILAQPKCAEFIVSKLWLEFVSPTPDVDAVARISGAFRDSGYDTTVALRQLFLEKAFIDAAGKGTLIKSPIELVVGAERVLQTDIDHLALLRSASQMGQVLFAPPNVKGWRGYTAWISTASLSRRHKLLRRFWKENLGGRGIPYDPMKLLVRRPVGKLASRANGDKRLFQVLTDPAFQLK